MVKHEIRNQKVAGSSLAMVDIFAFMNRQKWAIFPKFPKSKVPDFAGNALFLLRAFVEIGPWEAACKFSASQASRSSRTKGGVEPNDDAIYVVELRSQHDHDSEEKGEYVGGK